MTSTTNYYHNIDTLYVPINREQEPKPFEIHKNTVSFNMTYKKLCMIGQFQKELMYYEL